MNSFVCYLFKQYSVFLGFLKHFIMSYVDDYYFDARNLVKKEIR